MNHHARPSRSVLLVFTVYQEGDTALNLAIKMPYLRKDEQMRDLLRILLEAGTDISIQDIVSNTTIHKNLICL